MALPEAAMKFEQLAVEFSPRVISRFPAKRKNEKKVKTKEGKKLID